MRRIPSLVLCAVFSRSASANCTSSNPAYLNSIATGISGLEFFWNVDQESLSGQLVYTGGAAWLGVGISSDGGMLGADAVIGLPDENTVEKYELQGYSSREVVPSRAQTLTGTEIIVSDDSTIMTFTKLLVESNENPLTPNAQNAMIFAVGSSSTFRIHKEYSSLLVNLNSCLVSSGSGTASSQIVDRDSVQLHATLMVAAWMIFVPSGVIYASYKRHIGPRWIYFHMVTQILAVGLMLAAVVIIVKAVGDADADHMKHDGTTFGIHSILGVTALSIGGFQALVGFARPHKSAYSDAISKARGCFEIMHRGFGHVGIVVALFAILSGIEQAYFYSYINDKNPYLFYALVPFIAFFVALLLSTILDWLDPQERERASSSSCVVFFYITACFLAIGMNGPDMNDDVVQ